ncbi:MAG TPA: hypothetical protein VHY57_10275 [Rhizomicrobium sp.]|nr:hypothetical protein [Rhizomicrobium sp.]
MQTWDVDPELVAARVIEQFPYEAEHIVLDFLEGAANANDQQKALFWTIVLNLVEHIQMRMSGDTEYAPDVHFGAVM